MGNEQSSGEVASQEQQQEYLQGQEGPDRFRSVLHQDAAQENASEHHMRREFVLNAADERHAAELGEVERFNQGYGYEHLSKDIKRTEVLQQIKLVDQDVIKDKDFIEYPRMTLMSRQQERVYLPNHVHPAMQSSVMPQEIVEQTSKQVEKDEDGMERREQEQRQDIIREQLGRIQYLEDRMEILQKEISNQVFHLKYKHQQAVNFMNDYNHLRGETMAYHSRISQLEGQVIIRESDDALKKQLECELSIKDKEREIAELNEQVFYWKEKALADENCVSIITNLRGRAQLMIQENQKLKSVLFANEEYLEIKQFLSNQQNLQFQQEVIDQADELLRDFKDLDVNYSSEAYLKQNTTKKPPNYTAANLQETMKKQQKMQQRQAQPPLF